jgi:hypothetical protein
VNWIVGGVNWEDYLCTEVASFLDVCPPASGFTKPRDRGFNFCHADPFNVIGSFDCSTGGRARQFTSGEAFEIARQRLLQWEEHEVERVLWTGLVDNGTVNPSLQDGNDECSIVTIDLTPGGGEQDPVGALAALEEALTDIVPQGVIHVPYGLATYLKRFNLIEAEGGQLYTVTGTPVVVGAGYPGSGPGNVAADAGTTWMFGTGPVAVWQSDVFMVPDSLSQAIDRSINDVTVYAERYFAVGFACTALAVNVELVAL